MTKGRWRIIDNLLMQLKKWNKMMNMMNDEEIEFHKMIDIGVMLPEILM